jgi:hypothetical protein
MTTIVIEYGVSTETLNRIQSHLDDVAMRDINWNGAGFVIERGDFTAIMDNESPEAIRLLNEIQEIIADEER